MPFIRNDLVFNGVAAGGQANRHWYYANVDNDTVVDMQAISFFDAAGPGPSDVNTQAPLGDNTLAVGDEIHVANRSVILRVTAINLTTGEVTAGEKLTFA